jgi:hypothetical protein
MMVGTMSFSGLVAIAVLVQSLAFSPVPRPAVHVHLSPSILRTNPLFIIPEQTGDIDTTFPNVDKQTHAHDRTEGQKKIGLSLVPLILKFCVVLAVKFITDVLVFPPLFLWRFIRLIYRNTMTLIRKGSKNDHVTS